MPSNTFTPTPTLQHLFILNLDIITHLQDEEDYKAAWNAIKTFYHELPPDCEAELEPLFKETAQYLAMIPTKLTGDSLFSKNEIVEREEEYLAMQNLRLIEQLKFSLFAHNWLTMDFNASPRFGSGKF